MFSAGPLTQAMSTKNLSKPKKGRHDSTQLKKNSLVPSKGFQNQFRGKVISRFFFLFENFAFRTKRVSNEVFNRRYVTCSCQSLITLIRHLSYLGTSFACILLKVTLISFVEVRTGLQLYLTPNRGTTLLLWLQHSCIRNWLSSGSLTSVEKTQQLKIEVISWEILFWSVHGLLNPS